MEKSLIEKMPNETLVEELLCLSSPPAIKVLIDVNTGRHAISSTLLIIDSGVELVY